jgi:uncharacterized protein
MKNESPSPVVASPNASAPASTRREKKKRGFAGMDRNLVREISRRGGIAAHRAGTAHEFNAEEARLAGKKGGLALHHGRSAGGA